MRVRPAVRADLTDLMRLWERLAAHHVAVEPSLRLRENHAEFWRRWLSLRLGDGQTLVLVAEAPGSGPVGYLLAAVGDSLPLLAPEKVGYVEEAFILPEHRGRGLFRALLAEACAWMRRQGVTRVEADVYAANAGALQAWQAAGFRPLAVRMLLPLEPEE